MPAYRVELAHTGRAGCNGLSSSHALSVNQCECFRLTPFDIQEENLVMGPKLARASFVLVFG